MRILFLSQLLPLPLNAGAKIRSYYVLNALSKVGHEITLVCFVRPDDREQDIEELRRICLSVHTIPIVRSPLRNLLDGIKSLTTNTPFLILRDRVFEMRRRITEILDNRSFDAVHADQLWMAPYALDPAGSFLKVLDQHNAVFKIAVQLAECQSNPLIRFLIKREATKLAEFEPSVCRKFDKVVWVTDEDKRAVSINKTMNSDSNQVIPIAIDPSVQRPLERSMPFRVTFLGGMHWPPNAEGISWFVKQIWPKVSGAVPEAVLTLIGKETPKRLLREASDGRIHIAGYVSDLQPYLSETAAFIVPLHTGAGMRVKILDAWCWGLPVISTSIGASGIRARNDENLLIADDEQSFAECLIRVLKDPQLAQRLSVNGRSTVEAFYDWHEVYRAWNRIYQ